MVTRTRAAAWTIAVAAAAIAVSGCDGEGGSGGPDWDTGAGHRLWRDAGGGALPRFRVALPEGARLARTHVNVSTAYGEKGDCATPAWSAERGEAASAYTLFSVPTACPVDPSVNRRPINGRHPAYRDADDVPPAVADRAEHVRTPLGRALVFTQSYTECTQSCEVFDEPFAVITLDHPADRTHPVLVVTSSRGELDRGTLTRIVTKGLAAG